MMKSIRKCHRQIFYNGDSEDDKNQMRRDTTKVFKLSVEMSYKCPSPIRSLKLFVRYKYAQCILEEYKIGKEGACF